MHSQTRAFNNLIYKLIHPTIQSKNSKAQCFHCERNDQINLTKKFLNNCNLYQCDSYWKAIFQCFEHSLHVPSEVSS